MDQRFQRSWAQMQAARASGVPLVRLLRRAPTRELIGCLAAAARSEPVAANAIATELLNRQLRAPFLGAFLVSIGSIVATFLVDVILTGSPLLLLSPSSTRGYIVSAFMAAVGAFSLLMYVSWRGRVRWTHRLLFTRDLHRRRSH